MTRKKHTCRHEYKLTEMINKPHLVFTEKEKDEVLKRFMREFFPFSPLQKAGFFTKEMKGDYKSQSKRVCDFFGYETVYEYRAQEIRVHLTETNREPNTPFITAIPSIYES